MRTAELAGCTDRPAVLQLRTRTTCVDVAGAFYEAAVIRSRQTIEMRTAAGLHYLPLTWTQGKHTLVPWLYSRLVLTTQRRGLLYQ